MSGVPSREPPSEFTMTAVSPGKYFTSPAPTARTTCAMVRALLNDGMPTITSARPIDSSRAAASGRRTVLPRTLRGDRRALEARGGRVDRRRGATNALGETSRLPLGFRPRALLDGFAHARQRLHAVSGVEPRRVQQVLVPVAPRESLGRPEGALHPDEQCIHAHRIAGRSSRGRERGVVLAGALAERGERV